jgi:endonuclease/exonuclease/phosphatase family metal-dependent hydrolase
MAIFSKYPLKNVELIGFDKSLTVNGTIRADIQTPEGPIRLYCVHLQSIDFRPIDYAYLNQVKEKIKPELKPTRRIFGKLKIAFIKRAEQANEIHTSIEESPIPVLVMGDFNDTPVSYSYNTILGKLKSSFQEKGSGLGRTYNGSFPNFQIDHILCDSNFQICDFGIIEKKLSDHFPVRVNLLLHGKP